MTEEDIEMSDIINKYSNIFAYEEFRREQIKEILSFIYKTLGTIACIRVINALIRGCFKI